MAAHARERSAACDTRPLLPNLDCCPHMWWDSLKKCIIAAQQLGRKAYSCGQRLPLPSPTWQHTCPIHAHAHARAHTHTRTCTHKSMHTHAHAHARSARTGSQDLSGYSVLNGEYGSVVEGGIEPGSPNPSNPHLQPPVQVLLNADLDLDWQQQQQLLSQVRYKGRGACTSPPRPPLSPLPPCCRAQGVHRGLWSHLVKSWYKHVRHVSQSQNDEARGALGLTTMRSQGRARIGSQPGW